MRIRWKAAWKAGDRGPGTSAASSYLSQASTRLGICSCRLHSTGLPAGTLAIKERARWPGHVVYLPSSPSWARLTSGGRGPLLFSVGLMTSSGEEDSAPSNPGSRLPGCGLYSRRSRDSRERKPSPPGTQNILLSRHGASREAGSCSSTQKKVVLTQMC